MNPDDFENFKQLQKNATGFAIVTTVIVVSVLIWGFVKLILHFTA
jgi:hypothetical protein